MWAGKVSVKHALILVGQLQLNPHSRCRMIRLGGDPRWIGWDSNSELAASQHDLIVAFASGKSLSENDLYPRPGRIKKPDNGGLFAPSIADFNVGAFMQAINS